MKLWPFLKPYRWHFLVIGLLLMIIAFLTTLPPWLMQYAVDEVLPTGNAQWLVWLALGIVLLSLAEGLISFAQQVFSELVSQKVVHELRSQLFHHLNQLSFSFYDKARVGDLMARVVSDTDTLNRFIGFGLMKVITNFLVLIWIFITLFYWNHYMGLLFLALIPPMIHAMLTYAGKVRPAYKTIRKQTGILTSRVQENLAGIEVTKLFGNEEWQQRQFSTENASLLNKTLETNQISAFWMPYAETLLGFFTGLVLLAGGWLVAHNQMTAGTLVAFLAYVNMLRRPIRQTGFLLNLFSQGDAAASRILDILNQGTSLKDDPEAVPFERLQKSIAMENVSFSYDQEPVLRHINLQIQACESTALIGPSGAGKSTLIQLLLRFYQPDSGEVLIDNQPISRYTIASLRERIGFVMQHPFLFDGSLEENIALGSPKSSFQDIQEAAKAAGLDTFIQSLPSGYQTPVGERGVRLSGGQAQRLALARVLLKKPEILVLDEPTSSVDTVTDNTIMESVSQLMNEKTTIVIAHRLSTLQRTNRVVFLKEGTIKAQGTHHELMQTSKDYREFVSLSIREDF